MTKELAKPTPKEIFMKANPDILVNIESFKDDWYKFYKSISKTDTPKYDGNGLEIVRKRPDGLDYIIEAFMKDRLNYYFPGWSWRRTSPPQLLGAEWVITDGELMVIDERLMAFGISPPYRYFAASGASRIQFKTEKITDPITKREVRASMPHTPENLVDLDKQVKAANTNAFKKAINQLLGIGDDIYGKRIEEEGAGSAEDILSGGEDDIATATTGAQEKAFVKFVEQKRLRWSVVFKILEVESMSDIKDYKAAFNMVRESTEKKADDDKQ